MCYQNVVQGVCQTLRSVCIKPCTECVPIEPCACVYIGPGVGGVSDLVQAGGVSDQVQGVFQTWCKYVFLVQGLHLSKRTCARYVSDLV